MNFYKKVLNRETYLTLIKDFKLRNAISQLQLSGLKLAIEQQRHHEPRIAIENRIRIFCNNNCIESELHMIVECLFYSDEVFL